MYCKKCGQEVSSASKFCTKCGEETLKADSGAKTKLDISPASQGKRFANMLIDIPMYYASTFLFGMIIGFLFGYSENEGVYTFIGYLAVFLYFLIFEGIFNKSIAKFITKTKVVNRDGSRPEFLTIFWRTLARFIPFDAFSFLSGNKPIGWHDSISKTIVVND